jgi:hypothetical protein
MNCISSVIPKCSAGSQKLRKMQNDAKIAHDYKLTLKILRRLKRGKNVVPKEESAFYKEMVFHLLLSLSKNVQELWKF